MKEIDKIIEECSEVIHIACKIKRFGLDNWHPSDMNKTPNIEVLKKEMADVVDAFERFEDYLRFKRINKAD